MATRGQKIEVGVFVIVCSGLIIVVLALFAGVRREKPIVHFIEFDETVSGLYPGSEVRYRGVPIGSVTEITVTPQNRILVQIQSRPSVIRIRQGMEAQLHATGITGQLYINLKGGALGSPPLAPRMRIPSQPSLFANLSAQLPPLLLSVNALLVEFEQALKSQGGLGNMAHNAGELVTRLDTTVTDVGTRAVTLLDRLNGLAAGELRTLVLDLQATSQTLRRVLDQAAPAWGDALARSAETLRKLADNLAQLDVHTTNVQAQRALQRLTTLAEELHGTGEELTLTLQQVRGDTSNVELLLRQAVKSWRETLTSAKALFDYLEQDPAALLTGKGVPSRKRDGQRR
jgi:phospholipid/cholesterol/gamma-HCH transport system substrate-binding protein